MSSVLQGGWSSLIYNGILILYLMFDRSFLSINQHTEYSNFLCKIHFDRPCCENRIPRSLESINEKSVTFIQPFIHPFGSSAFSILSGKKSGEIIGYSFDQKWNRIIFPKKFRELSAFHEKCGHVRLQVQNQCDLNQ